MIVHKHFHDKIFLSRLEHQMHRITSGREKFDYMVVFTVGDLCDTVPLQRNQRKVATTNTLGTNTPLYSTGRLENAIASGHEVWVVTSKVGFDASDAWWQAFVPAERTFALLDRSEDTTYPWFRLMFTIISKLEERKRPTKMNQADSCDSVYTIKATLIRWNIIFGEHFRALSGSTP